MKRQLARPLAHDAALRAKAGGGEDIRLVFNSKDEPIAHRHAHEASAKLEADVHVRAQRRHAVPVDVGPDVAVREWRE